MRKTIVAVLVAAALAVTASTTATAQTPRQSPSTNDRWSRQSWSYPGWPWYPGYPWRPTYPRPRPPAVQIRYTVYYRASPYSSWRFYASYAQHSSAAAASRRLQAYGYQTDLVVTY